MKKRVIIFFLLGIVLGTYIGWYRAREVYSVNIFQGLSPSNTVFAFDLHNVVLNPQILKIVEVFWNRLSKKRFFKYLMNPLAWPYFYKIAKNQIITEQEFDNLIEDFPQLRAIKPLFFKLMTYQRLNYHAARIIDQLKKQGYSLYILSNIWPSALEDIKLKFPILADFKGYFVPSAYNWHTYKPHQIFYEEFKKFVKDTEKKDMQIIFIDNSPLNIKAANLTGIYGIPFDTLEIFMNKLKNFEKI